MSEPTVSVKPYDKPLQEFEGLQDINEVRQSIANLAHYIAESDLSSTFITSQRILSMRSLLDLLERYNSLIEKNSKNEIERL